MQLDPSIHRWNLTPGQAMALQTRLAGRVRQRPLRKDIRLVAGADCAILDDSKIIACWVVWESGSESVIEVCSVIRPLQFPYVPGLLSFREAPALLAAARKLRSTPQVFIVDGQGLAHPRRFGLACHLGLFLGRPTFGCAKSRLCGSHAEPPGRRGGMVSLDDRGEEIGRVVRTRCGVRPVYVSIGHLITLEDAVRVTLDCCTKYRLPEPTRLAHLEVGRIRREVGRAE